MGAMVLSSTNRWLDYPFTLVRTDEIVLPCAYCGRLPSHAAPPETCPGCGARLTTKKVETVIDVDEEREKRTQMRRREEPVNAHAY